MPHLDFSLPGGCAISQLDQAIEVLLHGGCDSSLMADLPDSELRFSEGQKKVLGGGHEGPGVRVVPRPSCAHP